MVHPSLAPALSDACRQLDFADCIAALCVSEEAPLPAVLAMYGCEGKDGLRWSTPASQSPLPLPHKGSTLELEGHLTVQRWLYDLIERVASSVPVLPPNMNPDETAALQLFDDKMEKLVGLKEIKERLRNFVLSVIHDGRRQHSASAQHIMHIAITGPSGIGKSKLANAIYRVLRALSLVNDSFIEVSDGSELKNCVRSKMQEAAGGVLFVDEAYQLKDCKVANGQLTGAINPKGFECGRKASDGTEGGEGPINALVIVAGYHMEMMAWLSPDNAMGNQGLGARISETYEMLAYTEEELMQIADQMLDQNYKATLASPQARTQLQAFCKDIAVAHNSQNARAIENLLRRVNTVHGARMVSTGCKEGSGNVYTKYTKADVDAGVKAWRDNTAARSRGTKRAAEPCASQGGSSRLFSGLQPPPQLQPYQPPAQVVLSTTFHPSTPPPSAVH